MVPHKQKIHATETLQNRNENQQKLWINKNQLFRLTIHIRLGSEGTVRQFGYVYFTIMNFISVILFQTAFQVLTTKSRWWARAAASRRRWQQAASLDGHHCPNTSAVTISQQPKNTQKNLLPQNSAHFYSLNDSICFYAIFLYRERNAFVFLNSSEISRRGVRGSLSVGDRGADWRSPEPTPPHAHRQTIFALFWLRF